MRRLYLFLSVLCLTACTVAEPHSSQVFPTVPGDAIEESATLEQVPAELSVEYFAHMRLSGTGLTLTGVLADEPLYTRYSITYQSNGLMISGIMNIPKGDGPFPLVVLNHGYIAPNVYTNGRGLKREQDYLARNGFAVIHSDYRGHASSDPSPDERMVYDAGLEYSMDSANAISAVRAANLPTVDAGRVGMLGHSLGGGVTLNIAVARPDLVDAVILYAPVHSNAWENFLRWRDEREEGDRTRALLKTREENPDAWNALSSLTHLADIDDPILLFHGSADESVPKEWSDFLAERLKVYGKEVTYVEYEGEHHEFIRRWDDFMERSVDFLHMHLAGEQWVAPLDAVYDRVSKKPFGIFITPQDSPVEPERFTGYHTGADFEVRPGEEEGTVGVRAVCSGEIIFKDWVRGYGGVVIQQCTRGGEPVTVLYGHLDIASVTLPLLHTLRSGDPLGTLGEGHTEETDGERKHLHLAVHPGTVIELRGYVQGEQELAAWVDPMPLLR